MYEAAWVNAPVQHLDASKPNAASKRHQLSRDINDFRGFDRAAADGSVGWTPFRYTEML